MSGDDPAGYVRIDRWLWAARFYKTRAMASQAVAGGKVEVDGLAVKPGRRLRGGERLVVRRGRERFEVKVRELAGRRGPAAVARTLYEESEESRRAREAERARRRETATGPRKRPGKHERRLLSALKRGRG